MTNSSKHQSELVKLDPAHVSAPGLFRSLNRKSRQRESSKLHVVYKPKSQADERVLEFHGPEPLGVDDLRVLQGLLAVATENFKGLANARIEQVEGEPIPAMPERLLVECGFGQLAKKVGYQAPGSGGTHLRIRQCIERMATVTIFYRESPLGRAIRLDPFIASYESDLASSGLRVELNGLMTLAILAGQKGDKYFKMRLDEVQLLKSDPARLIHHRLHYLNEGASLQIGLATLEGYVWQDACSANAAIKRRVAVKLALHELGVLGWSWKLEGDDLVRISRPKNSTKVREERLKALASKSSKRTNSETA